MRKMLVTKVGKLKNVYFRLDSDAFQESQKRVDTLHFMPNDDVNKFVSNKYSRGNLKIAHFVRFFKRIYISIEWLKGVLH